MKKKKISDFRYDTGPARIPWSAVGEKIKLQDIMEILKFLIPPKNKKYKIQLKKVEKELKKLIENSELSSKLTLGDKVRTLEEEVKKFLKCKYAVFLTNATAGFEIAYKFAGLKPGDEVIAPAITFIATISYPLSIGAKVVLVDVDPKTLNMDPEDLARKITKNTKVIVPVHIGGYPCDMDAIMDIARKFNAVVLEDAAHAFGAKYNDKMVGTIGHFGAFSFHEVKNITSLGEGGILVTNEKIGEDFPKARFVGFNISNPIPFWLYDVVALKWRGDYFAPGNHSATEIQAVALLSQMKRINKIIGKRRKAAEYLNERFKNVKGIVIPPLDDKKIKSTHHLYLFQVDPGVLNGDIQKVKEKMGEKGITQIPHFAPLYRFSIMKQLGYDTEKIKETCPNAEEVFLHRFTHLPLYDFKKVDLKYMSDTIIKIIKEMQK
ncbi:MAG TPA: DegT/DnrJ/EryC1/StrS family aminotransferase [bacterium]|nr:DegT/DnrJ/EryC1/StrS family aminotransferase [bacterium]HOM25968.1 DegT/DnrJ/EryC1/StrS family aminotransferase [bacterium]